jgi:hypothetical protein
MHAKSANFMKGSREQSAGAKCMFSTIFSSFTIHYYTPMYYEVNLNNGTTYR